MSFFKSLKGLADDFKDMMSDKEGEKKKDEKPLTASTTNTGNSDRNLTPNAFPDQSSQQYYNNDHQPHDQPSYRSQHQYQPRPQYQQDHPPTQGYGSAPLETSLPQGWIQQWDPNSQRYYYLEQVTGRTQWDPPVNQDRGFGISPAPPGHKYQYQGGYQPGHDQGHSYGAPEGIGHPGGANYHSESVRNGDTKQGSNKGALLAAGAGGLALGSLAGAALAGDSSDEEHHTSAPPAGYGAPPTGYGAPQAGYIVQPAYGVPLVDDPQALEHNSNVSSSQRSSLEEARHDYEEAQRKAADSDASSSDQEEAEEARQEYEEEIEEARSEAED